MQEASSTRQGRGGEILTTLNENVLKHYRKREKFADLRQKMALELKKLIYGNLLCTANTTVDSWVDIMRIGQTGGTIVHQFRKP